MQALSASEAISPAIERTKLLLFKPFRLGRTWKLAATAYLSVIGTVFLPFPLLYCAAIPFAGRLLGPRWVTTLVAAAVLMTVLVGWVFALCSRLQFAFFDVALNRGEFVTPAWRKYGNVARPWTWAKILSGSVLAVVLAALFYPAMRRVVASLMILSMGMPKSAVPGRPLPPEFLGAMVEFYGLYFALMGALVLVYLAMSTLSAFMVPMMALEGISPRVALARLKLFVQHETGAFFGFVGLRLALAMAAYFGAVLAYELVLLVLALVFAAVCGVIYLVLHAAHVPVPVLIGLGITALVLFLVGVNGYVMFLTMGTVLTFFEAHTLYFLAGRYPLLGEALERSTPPPPARLWPQPPPYGWPSPPGVPPPPQ